ncbi:hypothetical protein PR202_ga31392 [Eleusine coracana subsp. coracana]|uniref:Disease resistance N-terminal domain-containing protein n=1 Tax=Eleusine coracana subsp. coracana TaxID=191504 RepID=A0AAV5DQX0_ELECO|nr:hypothetical protein PR202_ga31392 [Eleusine coracana subsp. coracana]
MGEMQYFLSEADNRRIEESAVDNLVCGLRDALYDADDIIDLAKFEGSKLLMDNRSSSSRNTVCSVLSVLSCFCNLKIRRKVSMQIKILNDRLKDISGDNTFWTLNNDTCLGKYSETNHRTSSHLVEPMLVGNHITISTAKLVDLVLVNKEKQNYKIGIVGTVGIGKTTLAQKVYNHQRMNFFNASEHMMHEVKLLKNFKALCKSKKVKSLKIQQKNTTMS